MILKHVLLVPSANPMIGLSSVFVTLALSFHVLKVILILVLALNVHKNESVDPLKVIKELL